MPGIHGRYPDLRVEAWPTFPTNGQWYLGIARRLQLRGQLRLWHLLANPDRIPFSSHGFSGPLRTVEFLCHKLSSSIKAPQRPADHIE